MARAYPESTPITKQNIARAYGTGVGARRGHRYLMQSCCSQCYVIQPVHNILHECVVGCPILSSTYKHVPIKHSTSSYTLCALTSHYRVRCSSGLKQIAKHH